MRGGLIIFVIFVSSCMQRCPSQAMHPWDTSPSACSPLTMTWHFFPHGKPGCPCSPLHPSPPHAENLGHCRFHFNFIPSSAHTTTSRGFSTPWCPHPCPSEEQVLSHSHCEIKLDHSHPSAQPPFILTLPSPGILGQHTLGSK